MNKLFVLAIGDSRRASSRLRVWDHLDWFKEKWGKVYSDYVVPATITRTNLSLVFRLLIRLPVWTYQFFKADDVYIQESLWLAPLVMAKKLGKYRTVVYDFSDPVDLHGGRLVFRCRQWAFKVMTERSDHVIVENKYYLNALKERQPNLSHFYGPINVERYQAYNAESSIKAELSGAVNIGWTGSPATLKLIEPLFPVLDELAGDNQIALTLIGVTKVNYSFSKLNVRLLEWSEFKEFEEVPQFDIGLYRLDDSENSKRRGAGKLFIYMSAAVAYVASNKGIAKDLMSETNVGFPVDNDEWLQVLKKVVANSADRKRHGQNAVAYAYKNLSYQKFREKLIATMMAS